MWQKKQNTIIISTLKFGDLYFAVGLSKKGKIIRISLPNTCLNDVISEISDHHPEYHLSDEHLETLMKIARIYNGENIDFNMELLELDLENKNHETSSINSSFERDVILEVAKIPYGNIKTYKEIAESLNTKGYRAVGTAIGKNPFPIVVPCHRVIRSDRNVGGFRGGTEMKVNMLNKEGLNIEKFKIKFDKSIQKK
jgi:methylated-DNA-[protein]-cysteine S-methyltransferase